MLFNSFTFLFFFLPMVLAGYWLVSVRENTRLWFLVVASLVFYAWWDVSFVPLLLVSVLLNWLAAGLYAATRRKAVAVLAITANLASLGFYKYLGFFAGIARDLSATTLDVPALALPLGISFYTFHHIIYWADLIAGRAPRYGLRDYSLYIVLFPQILAGPLVRHSEIVHQFRLDPARPGWEERMARGTALFIIGLCKKLFLADALARMAEPVFSGARHGPVMPAEAWQGALAFTGQIYFDFSGYSDMAIGLALLFGLTLPVNFDAPYRAASLRDFWRRWHMTLSRFLRDYLYVPMGGNRAGLIRQCLALVATMGLGGLWHGAGWTFIVWGLAHGVALALGVLWRRLGLCLPVAVGWPVTMLFVVATWVLFRAETLPAATAILEGMLGWRPWDGLPGWRTLLVALAIAVLGPTSQQAVAALRPRAWLAVGGAVATVAALLTLNEGVPYEFIYFQF